MMSFLYITRFIWPFIFVIALTCAIAWAVRDVAAQEHRIGYDTIAACAIAGLSLALMYSLVLYLI